MPKIGLINQQYKRYDLDNGTLGKEQNNRYQS